MGINLGQYVDEKKKTNIPNFIIMLVVGVGCLTIAATALPRGDVQGSVIMAAFGAINLIGAYKFRSVIKK